MQRLRTRAAETFASAQQAEAMALLRDGLADGDPVLLLTGAAGLGKTTLLHAALDTPDRAGVRTLVLQPPFPAPLAVHGQLAALADLTDGAAAAPAALAEALRRLAAGPNGVAVTVAVDGAEAVPAPLLRYLWLIHTLCATEQPTLQLVLIGRDALWRRLSEDDLAGLRRGVSARIALQAWPDADMAGLLAHLLAQRGRKAEPDAATEILRHAAGVPGRLVTVLDAACAGLPPRRSLSLAALRVGLGEPAAVSGVAPRRRTARLLAARLPSLRGRSVPVAAVAAALGVVAGAVWLLSGSPAATPMALAPVAPAPGARPAVKVPVVHVAHAVPAVPVAPAAAAVPPALPDFTAPDRFALALLHQADAAGADVAAWVRGADHAMADLVPANPPRLAGAPRVASAPRLVSAPPRPAVPSWRADLGPAIAVAARTLPRFIPPLPPLPPPPAEAQAGPPPIAAAPAPVTTPMLVLADATAIHVRLLYPRGDAPAEARARRAAAALQAQHIDTDPPEAIARMPTRPGVSYFFTADREGARRVAGVVAGLVPPGPIEALPLQASPPPPGTVEVLLAGY